jgi:hypothetical protein
MNTRRFRNDSTQRLAEFRWWGCVLLAMFAAVRTSANIPMAAWDPSPQHAHAGDSLIQTP